MMRYVAFLSILLIACENQKGSKHSDESDSAQLNTKAVAEDTTKAIKEDSGEYFDLSNFQKLVEKYEDPERAEWQNPELVIDQLGKLEGKTIADIGAGSGYFTFRLAEKGATVIAIDIDDRFLEHIETRKIELNSAISPSKITTRLSKEDDPLLKKDEVDLALIVNTYHFIENRTAYLEKVSAGLKPNGTIVIVDYEATETPVGPPESYKVSSEKVVEEMQKAGLNILEVDTKSLNYQYIIKANKK